MKPLLCLMICALCLSSLLLAKEEENQIHGDEWLILGPMNTPFPAFSEKTTQQAMLKESYLDLSALWPKQGQSQSWTTGHTHMWTKKLEDSGKPDIPKTAYFAGYLQSSSFQSVTLTVKAPFPFDLYLDGIKKTGAFQKNKQNLYEANTDQDLRSGKYCLIIKGAFLLEEESEGSLQASFKFKKSLKWTLDPKRAFSKLKDAFVMDSASQVKIAPDGKLIAIQRSIKRPESVTWIEILDLKTREIKGRLKSGNTPTWSPSGDLMAFRSRSSIYAWRRADNTVTPILLNESGLSSFFWAPDSKSMFFLTHSNKSKGKDFTRIYDPRDRLTDWDTTRKVHMIGVDGKSQRTLTATGDFEITQAAISNSGTHLALVRRDPIKKRPFFTTQFWVMDLKKQTLDLIKTTRFSFENSPSHLVWSPDDKKIAFKAPPGETPLPGHGEEHNAFDSCLWTLDLKTKSMIRLSDRFGDSVESPLIWSKADNKIYFIANHRALQRLVRIQAQGDQGLEVLTETPTVITRFSLTKNAVIAAFIGSSIDVPSQVYLMDIPNKKQTLFLDPNKDFMKGINLGDWERFNFKSQDNDPVDGWIFYPPDFDLEKKYPMIVYYYGGTSPRLERFTVSSYHWLAANGYVLYVVNPAGHVGHTHKFSAKHCNDWGKLAGRDIIEGTKRVLEAKPFIDPKRLACYGGSYGGFMTLHLATECDLFKAGCSMYGISNLTSYWGAGIWGYTYGDTAMASNYPWTNPDLFVKQSPIYKAHKINTALLLVHGDADLNVPSNESEQMFTALKVLGKDAAYIRFKGEGHGISSKRSNLLAHRYMMLEWFDKYLKDQPEGWEKRWGKK